MIFSVSIAAQQQTAHYWQHGADIQFTSALGLLTVLLLLAPRIARDFTRRRSSVGSKAANCTAPMTLADAQKQYSFVPDTVSPEAQRFLSTARPGILPANLKDDAKAVQDLRRLAASSNSVRSQKAEEQYLQGTQSNTINGVPVVYATPKGYNETTAGSKLIIYLHGGGYVFNSAHSQWHMVALVAQESGLRVLAIEYRLAPENPFPAGLNDALAVYKELTNPQSKAPYKPQDIAVIADSAGGGMALAMIIQLQREGLSLPGALVLFSPWVDVAKHGDTLTTLVGPDRAITYEGFKPLAAAYVGGDLSKFDDPLLSPLRADYADLFRKNAFPPTLFQLGTRDSLLSGSIMLYRKLKAAGQTGVVFSPWEGMWHDFQQFVDMPEAQAAQQEAAQFIRQHLGCSRPPVWR